jgi:hypothetical protein
VMNATGNKQEPFVYGSLGGDDVALVPAPAVAPVASGNANADIRRDYELAERVGTREAWDSFVAAHPGGFYTDLAKAQRNKLAAETARLAATEKARNAAEEQARLAAEGAKASEQAKAVAQSKAAEEARLAAEKKKQIEDAKLAVAEQMKAAAQARAAEKAAEDERLAAEKARLAAEKIKQAEDAKLALAEQAKAAAQAKAAEQEKQAAEKAKKLEETRIAAAEPAKPKDEKPKEEKPADQATALLTPGEAKGDAAKSDAPPTQDIPRLLQTELRRVGCKAGDIDGEWNASARRALSSFNDHAGTRFDVKLASLDALDAVKAKTGRVCPLDCERGYRANGDHCVKISCDSGYVPGSNGNCQKRAPRVTQRERHAPALPKRKCFVFNGTSVCE